MTQKKQMCHRFLNQTISYREEIHWACQIPIIPVMYFAYYYCCLKFFSILLLRVVDWVKNEKISVFTLKYTLLGQTRLFLGLFCFTYLVLRSSKKWLSGAPFWSPCAMRGNNFKEKKVIPLIFTEFWIRSHLNKLDRLTPQEV